MCRRSEQPESNNSMHRIDPIIPGRVIHGPARPTLQRESSMKKSTVERACLVATALAVLVVLAACHGAGAPSAAAAGPFGFTEIRIGASADVGAQARPQLVATTDPVIVTMITRGQPKDAELKARLISLGTGQEVDQKLHLSPATTSPVILRFDADANRKPGRYLLELQLDGKFASIALWTLVELVHPSLPHRQRARDLDHALLMIAANKNGDMGN
jgi:hypothetical protein